MTPLVKRPRPFDITQVRLNGRHLLARVAEACTGLSMDENVDAANSVTMDLRDGSYDLLRSGIFVPGVELTAWDRQWVFTGLDEGSDRGLGVVFESKRANTLKRNTRRMKIKGTRVAFTKAVFGSARVPVVFPDATRISGPTVGSLGVGLAASDTVRVRGRSATREQRLNLDTVLREAHRVGAAVSIMRALVAAVIAESNALNVVAGAADRGGVLRLSGSIGARVSARDPKAVAAWFVGQAAQGEPASVASAVLDRPVGRYEPFTSQAALIVKAFLGIDVVRERRAGALVRKQLTQRLRLGVGAPFGEAGESRWEAVARTWNELGWYLFETPNGMTIVSGQHISVAKPDAVLSPTDPWVIRASFQTDEGFRVDSASIEVLEDRVGVLGAGMVVDLRDYGRGTGRYIAKRVTRNAGSRVASVELETPRSVVQAQNQSSGAKQSTGGSGGGASTFGGSFRWPTASRVITSPFGVARPGHMHAGIDIGVPIGTPVLASAAGTVAFAGVMGGYGNCIDIRHSANRKTRYGHLDSFNVTVGAQVSQGQMIARSGNTGRSSGPHLHFEIHAPSAVNPLPLLS